MVANVIEGRTVLVTGASGFIGSHLVRRLVADGDDVHITSPAVSSLYPARLVDLREQLHLHEVNLIDRSALEYMVRDVRPTHIFHLAAYTHVGKSWHRIDECVQTNVQGTVNLLQALEPIGYQRFVNTGTSEIYGSTPVPFREDVTAVPASPYSMTKFAAEMFCQLGHDNHGWPIVRVRPFNGYGPAQTPDRIIPEVIIRALRKEPLLMTSGTQTREFNFVTDLVDGLVRAASAPGVEGELINVGNGQEITIADLTRRILALMGDPIEAQFGALPDRPIEIWRMFCDNTRARELLGWKPTVSLDDGLSRTIDWYRDEFERDPLSPFIPGFARGT